MDHLRALTILLTGFGLTGGIAAQTLPTASLGASPVCGASHTSDVVIDYTLEDDQSDPCTILLEYTTDAGVTWLVPTESADPSSEGTSGLSSSPPPGVSHVFVWDSRADIPALSPGVMLRITPDDGTAPPPSAMAVVGNYTWTNPGERLDFLRVSGSRLYATTYLAWGSASIGVILDLANPVSPTYLASTVSLGTTALAATADAEVFITGERSGQLTVFDGLAATSPVPASQTYDTSYDSFDCLEIVGDNLFYAEQEASSRPAGLHVFDINRGARTISFLGSDTSTARDARGLAVHPTGDHAYHSDFGCRPSLGCNNANLYQIWAYNTATRNAPVMTTSGLLLGEEIRVYELTVSASGDTLIATGRHHDGAAWVDPPVQTDGLILFDLSVDPDVPTPLATLTYDCLYHTYDPATEIVYLADVVTDELIAVDISNPAAPVQVDALAGANARHMDYADTGHVYFVGSNQGVDAHIVSAVSAYVPGVAPTPVTSCIFDVDNTQLCAGICGDCNLDAAGPGIIDALTAAQVAAGLIIPGAVQLACCDVNSTTAVEILDALLLAQYAAGLPVTLTCL
jgi:hypothetical protein